MAIEMMSISHCYCSDYMTKPTQFGDEPVLRHGDRFHSPNGQRIPYSSPLSSSLMLPTSKVQENIKTSHSLFCRLTPHQTLLSCPVDHIDASRRQSASNDIFPIKSFAKTNAARDCSYHWNERVEDSHLAHRIASEQLVVE